jgi:hypothetical protein
MAFKISLFFISLLSIYQVWYQSKLVSVFAKPVLQVADYNAFSDEFKTLALWIGFLLLICCFLSSRKSEEPDVTSSSYSWVRSFMLIISICIVTVLLVNPNGYFPWNQRTSYITLAAHSIKPNLYRKLSHTPELLIFGSSISFTTPASYFKKNWGVNAFNQSVEGGGPIDFVKIVNFVTQESPDKKTPETIVIEMLSPGLRPGNPGETSLTMIPYLSIDQAASVFGTRLDDLVLSSSFADSIFTLLFVDTHRWELWISFVADGSGVLTDQTPRALTDYQTSIKNDLSLGKSLISCQNLSPVGKEYIEKLISLSHAQQFSIVFYRPPINADLYTVSKTAPSVYERCRNLLNTYMNNLAKKNPNIFYRDLSNDTKISSMGRTVYLDTHHLNEYGNTLVMQTLNKEIKAALTWSKANHK